MKYQDRQEISYSSLKILDENPNLFYLKYISKEYIEESITPALLEGRLFDELLTGGEKNFKELYTIIPDIKSTTKPMCITEITYERISNMCNKIYAKEFSEDLPLQKLLKNGNFQEEVIWLDTKSFENLKGKLDWISKDKSIIIDFKTTTNISDFFYAVKKYKYYLQVAMYCSGIKAKYNLINYPDFYFVVVEKSYPHYVRIYKVSLNTLNFGLREMDRLITLYQYYKTNNKWVKDDAGYIEI